MTTSPLYWTAERDALLLARAAEGVTPDDLAPEFKRSPIAIYNRLRFLTGHGTKTRAKRMSAYVAPRVLIAQQPDECHDREVRAASRRFVADAARIYAGGATTP